MTDQKSTQEDLVKAITKLHHDYLNNTRLKKRLPREFIVGIVRGFGIALGGTIVFAVVLYLFGKLPAVQNFLNWIETIR